MGTLKFVIERPAPWLNEPLDGSRHRRFFANLLMAVTETGHGLDTADIPFGGDFAPRYAAPDRILLSYHSVGACPDVWRLKESYIAPYYYFDRTGYSGWAQIAHDHELQSQVDAVDAEAAGQFVDTLRAGLVARNESKYQQSAVPARALPSDYVFFATQVVNDSVARLARIESSDLLRALVQEARRTGVPLVIKRHPLCNHPSVDTLLADAQRDGAFVSDASIHTLIGHARSVVTVNSGVGFEALVHGKPVYTAGLSDYDMVTVPLRNVSDVAMCFHPAAPDAQRVQRFISFYLQVYCVDGSDPASIQRRLRTAIAMHRQATSVDGDAEDFAHLEVVRYFAMADSLRRRLVSTELALKTLQSSGQRHAQSQSQSQSASDNAEADQVRLQLVQANASSYKMICELYARLSEQVPSYDELRQRNRSMNGGARNQHSFTPAYYQQLHDRDGAFQQNNWLLPYLDVFAGGGISSVREVGCGNGAFLRAVRPYVAKVVGVDWARSPQLPKDDAIDFVQADITAVDLSPVDVNCSADVLEHLPFDAVPSALQRLHQSALVNFHVVACYDDGHSHLSIFQPDEWLYMFRQHSPDYRLFDISVRHNDTEKVVCAITNWPSAPTTTSATAH